MYLTQLSLLNLDLKTINKLNEYLTSLSLSARERISFLSLKTALELDDASALELKTKLEENGYIINYYVIYCPNCGLLIKKFNDISEINDCDKCYNCESEILKDKEFIDFRYRLNDKIFPYDSKQGLKITPEEIREYSLKNGNRNNLLYYLTESEKTELLKDLDDVINKNFQTTKAKGDALEKFTLKLFKKIRCLDCFTMRTSVNQIDNMLCNKLHRLVFEGLSKYIIVECKNEEQGPDVTYIDKICGVTNTFNDSNLFNTGLVVSKEKPTSKFIETSYLYISNKNQVAVISITIDEIKNLLESDKNLIDFIEHKLLLLHSHRKN